MDSDDDRRPLAAADDGEDHILSDAISRSLNLNSPELPPYWNEGTKANWLHLPREVLAMILLKLSAIEIIESAQNVCTMWNSVCMDPSLWTHIDMCKRKDNIDMPNDLAKMCRQAIDRSRGGCVDISITNFGDDDLLNYIVERYVAGGLCLSLGYEPFLVIRDFPRFNVLNYSGCKLRRLRLACCWSVSDEGMAEAASRLPFLETFEYYKGNLAENALKAIGQNCPRLTTLLYEQQKCFPCDIEKDDEAFSIAKHMPGLRRLSLLGNNLTDKGLGAILDGCPHLESLDLRQCFKVFLMVNKKKCERIEDLKCPWDPIASDYENYYSEPDYISEFDYEDYFTIYWDFPSRVF